MPCTVSYALGHWRGFWRREQWLPLCPRICVLSYDVGYADGLAFRRAREQERMGAGL